MKKLTKILLAEESNFIIREIKQELQPIHENSMFIAVHNLEEAKSVLKYYHPDIFITDIQVGNQNSLELIQEGKKNHLFHTSIILTHFTQNMFKDMAAENGADYFLDKNDQINDLPAIIDKAAHHHN